MRMRGDKDLTVALEALAMCVIGAIIFSIGLIGAIVEGESWVELLPYALVFWASVAFIGRWLTKAERS